MAVLGSSAAEAPRRELLDDHVRPGGSRLWFAHALVSVATLVAAPEWAVLGSSVAEAPRREFPDDHDRPGGGRLWSRLKRYRLLILFAEFVLKANPYFLNGEDTETNFDF